MFPSRDDRSHFPCWIVDPKTPAPPAGVSFVRNRGPGSIRHDCAADTVVATICAAEILGLTGFSIVSALLPQFIETWSLTNTQAGWLAGDRLSRLHARRHTCGQPDRPARQLYLASSVLSALSCFKPLAGGGRRDLEDDRGCSATVLTG
jgi:hypothetical protein